MKRVLFLSLALAVGMTAAFAQKVTVKKGDVANTPVLTRVQAAAGNEAAPTMNFTPNEVMTSNAHRIAKSIEEWETMHTNYDLQSNSALGNRWALWSDGTAATVITRDYNNSTSYPDRGTGYNYFDGEGFGDEPDGRIESSYSGWPSISAMGNGEILASHGGGNVNVFARANKGEGDWEARASVGPATWPRIATTHNGEYVHLVCAEQNSSNTLQNYVYYMRSTDGGQTFTELAYPPEVDVEGMYKNDIAADDYVIATNGDRIAILFGGMNYDVFYIYSEDNGDTWTKQIVAPWPYDHALDWNQTAITSDTDSIWACDNSMAIAIDDNGVVHVAFGLTRMAPAPESGAGYYSYWAYTDAIVYWNSEYVNENGGHEIPLFGEWSGDAMHPEWAFNGTNGVSSTLNDDRLWELAEEDGHNHLHLFGWPDETGDGEVDYSELWDNHWGSYRSLGISTTPSISIDQRGNMIIAYTVLSESRVSDPADGFYYRSAYVTARDFTGTWFDDAINLSSGFYHSIDEVYYTATPCQGMDENFWVGYNADPGFGLFLDEDQTELTDNIWYAVRVNPSDLATWSVSDNNAVNPLTAARVYPNPATDVVSVEINALQGSDANISVYNIMGQKVAEKNITISTGMNETRISTNELSSGVYFVTVKANGFEKSMKFVVK